MFSVHDRVQSLSDVGGDKLQLVSKFRDKWTFCPSLNFFQKTDKFPVRFRATKIIVRTYKSGRHNVFLVFWFLLETTNSSMKLQKIWGCAEATRQNESHRLAVNCCPVFQGALNPEHFSVTVSVPLIMSRLKADKLIPPEPLILDISWYEAQAAWGEDHIYLKFKMSKTLLRFSQENRLWNVLMKMSTFLFFFRVGSLKWS